MNSQSNSSSQNPWASPQNPSLPIYEFSTGIKPAGDVRYWVSEGFTGQYMHNTFPGSIPKAVDIAIKNRNFEVREGLYGDRPAIIGRAISGANTGESDWSVIALVVPGKDNQGRNFGFYRYFVCEGKDNLNALVAWLEKQKHNKGGYYPVFNPYDPPQPNQSLVPITPNPIIEPSWLSSTPAIVPLQQPITLPQVNQLAEQKAQITNRWVSWAYDIEGLEQPDRFLVIKPASSKAEALFNSMLATSPKSGAVQAPIAEQLDTQGIKTTLKGLISSSQVNPDFFHTFVASLQQVDQQLGSQANHYWQDIFNSLGATDAFKQSIYTSQMIRLITLMSIAIPEVLHGYLKWLKIDKNVQQNQNCKIALDFQSQLRYIISQPGQNQGVPVEVTFSADTDPNFRLIEGIKNVLARYHQNKINRESVSWLLSSGQSLWQPFTNLILEDIFLHDFEQSYLIGSKQKPIAQYQLQGEVFDQIWLDLQHIFAHFGTSKIAYSLEPRYRCYRHLAELLHQLDYPFQAACFYQIGTGEVPLSVYREFDQIRKRQPYFKVPIFKLKPELTRLQQVVKSLNSVNPNIITMQGIATILLSLIAIPVLFIKFIVIPLAKLDLPSESDASASSDSESTVKVSNDNLVNLQQEAPGGEFTLASIPDWDEEDTESAKEDFTKSMAQIKQIDNQVRNDQEVKDKLQEQGISVGSDLYNEKVAKTILETLIGREVDQSEINGRFMYNDLICLGTPPPVSAHR